MINIIFCIRVAQRCQRSRFARRALREERNVQLNFSSRSLHCRRRHTAVDKRISSEAKLRK